MADTEKRRKDDTEHPAGFFGGGGTGAVVGAAIGSAAGPAGTVAGAAIGGLAGAKAGEGIAEAFDPDEEDAYWRDNFRSRSYAAGDSTYDEYEPAYRAGYMGYAAHGAEYASFDQAEPDIRRSYEESEDADLDWGYAREAARDAWNRRIQLREERLRVEKERQQTGEVEGR